MNSINTENPNLAVSIRILSKHKESRVKCFSFTHHQDSLVKMCKTIGEVLTTKFGLLVLISGLSSPVEWRSISLLRFSELTGMDCHSTLQGMMNVATCWGYEIHGSSYMIGVKRLTLFESFSLIDWLKSHRLSCFTPNI